MLAPSGGLNYCNLNAALGSRPPQQSDVRGSGEKHWRPMTGPMERAYPGSQVMTL